MAVLILFKPGVSMRFLHPVTLRGMADVGEAWAATFPDLPFVITSIQDGQHLPTGFHPKGLAFDFRIHTVPRPSLPHLELFVRGFRKDHPPWQVLLEGIGTPGEHGHAEYDEGT